ncbi:hypothetical protein L0657_25945 [Dyadobacter sp. CY345]|uniref:hypothetical protein n=1 Tax=Dyadobacter sp. CY345 TaxID=2909335 RepID=UPI001F393CF2|nr:hypothetical protein [Dyadobacter sp. CY345]MCF2447423.1 hypothetical protein [Dyadobacter sp. CY345]
MNLYKNIFRKLAVLTFLFYWVAVNGFQLVKGQGVLQVATKSIEKTVTAHTIRTLFINAEKADIELIAWDKAEILVVMELSARHPDKRTAASDLGKIQYIADRSGKDYFLRNYILLKEGESKPLSNLKARYTIHLPPTCSVDLKNTFGTIQMKGLTNNLKLSADFCTTSLANIKGKGLLETTFGELKAIEISGTFSFTSDHTNLQLENIGGVVRMNTLYGNVEISPSAGLTSLAIQSKKAVITMVTKNWQRFDYDINSAYTTMKLPNGFKWKRNTPDFKDAFFSKNRLANVQISAEFGNLTIK